MTKEEFCERYDLNDDQFQGKEMMAFDWSVQEEEIPENFSLWVQHDLYLDKVLEIPKNFNARVGLDLVFNKAQHVLEDFKTYTKGMIHLENVRIIKSGFKPSAEYIYLDKVELIGDGFKPECGMLWINGSVKFEGEYSFEEVETVLFDF